MILELRLLIGEFAALSWANKESSIILRWTIELRLGDISQGNNQFIKNGPIFITILNNTTIVRPIEALGAF